VSNDKFFRGGDYYQIDDITGIKVRASRTRRQWDGRVTRPESFSPRQPQDLVMGVRDDQSVPVPRPRQKNRFVVVGTEVNAPAAFGSNAISVNSTVGFNVGDLCQVMTDQGDQFQFHLGAIAGNVLSWTGAGLSGTVGMSVGSPPDNAVVDLTSIGGT
jgi:hypothetical protein